MNLENWDHLLALAFKPKFATSILDWQPFEKDVLGQIIDLHNAKIIDYFKNHLEWDNEDIEKHVRGIDILSNDLSKVGDLTPSSFASIEFILADLDAISEEAVWLNALKFKMARNDKKYWLLQVAKKQKAESCRKYFTPLPVRPPDPEVFSTQDDFESWLSQYGEYFSYSMTKMHSFSQYPLDLPKNPWDKKVKNEYLASLSKLARNVADTAMTLKLPKEDTENLADFEAMRSFFLLRVAEQVPVKGDFPINLDGLIKPMVKIGDLPSLKVPCVEMRGLVEVGLNCSVDNLSYEQRKAAINMGMYKNNSVAVLIDQKSTWDKLGSLKNVVECQKFKAHLPIFKQ